MQGQPLKISHNPNIDAVRGLAVLGIFFLNVSFMGVTLYGYAPFPEFHLTDAITETLSNFCWKGASSACFPCSSVSASIFNNRISSPEDWSPSP